MDTAEQTTRHKAREMALQILFQTEFVPHLDLEQAIELYRQHLLPATLDLVYCKTLVEGIKQNRAALDGLIQSHSQNWKVSRMSLVDANILRIAAYEIRFSQPPIAPKVAIDEAVELAKHYGTTESAAFVNGVLDRFAQPELAGR